MTVVKFILDVKTPAEIAASNYVPSVKEPVWRSDGYLAFGDGVTVMSGLAFLPMFSGGQVDSISGTSNRITVDSTDPANPVVDISSSYDTAITNEIAAAVSGKEDTANKQTDLTASATKYPTVDAVNAGLGLLTGVPVVATTATTLTPAFSGEYRKTYRFTGLASALTIAAPTGTIPDGALLRVEIRDNNTPRAITHNAAYIFSPTLPAPTITLANKWVVLGYCYNATDGNWKNLAQLNNLG